MQNTTPMEKTLDDESLLVVSLLMRDIIGTVNSIQLIAAVLLQYGRMALSITNCLVGLIAPTAEVIP